MYIFCVRFTVGALYGRGVVNTWRERGRPAHLFLEMYGLRAIECVIDYECGVTSASESEI